MILTGRSLAKGRTLSSSVRFAARRARCQSGVAPSEVTGQKAEIAALGQQFSLVLAKIGRFFAIDISNSVDRKTALTEDRIGNRSNTSGG